MILTFDKAEDATSILSQSKQYIKKPIPIRAIQIKCPFEVKTLEGLMKGKKDDYLIEGTQGELYPCDKEIFEKTYYEVP